MKVSFIFFNIFSILIIIACEEMNNNDTEEQKQIIEISSGTTPTFSWSYKQPLENIAYPSVGNISHLYVHMDTIVSGKRPIMWQLTDCDTCLNIGCNSWNGIPSPVNYGVVPIGSFQYSDSVVILKSGSKYIVSIWIEKPPDVGAICSHAIFERFFTP